MKKFALIPKKYDYVKQPLPQELLHTLHSQMRDIQTRTDEESIRADKDEPLTAEGTFERKQYGIQYIIRTQIIKVMDKTPRSIEISLDNLTKKTLSKVKRELRHHPQDDFKIVSLMHQDLLQQCNECN